MDIDEGLSVPIDNHRTLWLTEIARATFESQALDDLGSDCGLFLVLEDCSEGRFDVLAKATSSYAGQLLLEMTARNMTIGSSNLRVVP